MLDNARYAEPTVPEASIPVDDDTTGSMGSPPMATISRDHEDDVDAGSLVPAVTRAGAILDMLAENTGAAAGPSELARRLGLPKSSIANICNAMADIGLLRR